MTKAARVRDSELAQLDEAGGLSGLAPMPRPSAASLPAPAPGGASTPSRARCERMRQRYVEVRQRASGPAERRGRAGPGPHQDHSRLRAAWAPDAAHRVLRPILDARVDTTPDAVSPTLVVLRETFASRIGPAEEQARDRLDEERNKTADRRRWSRSRRTCAGARSRAANSCTPSSTSWKSASARSWIRATRSGSSSHDDRQHLGASLPPRPSRLLSATIRALRERLLRDLRDEAERRYRLSVSIARRGWTRRHDGDGSAWRRGWTSGCGQQAPRTTRRAGDAGAAYCRRPIKEAAATLLNRLVLLRHLEAMGLSRPAVVTGGWNSKGYGSCAISRLA